jgi:ATP-dependent DNA helicase RecG
MLDDIKGIGTKTIKALNSLNIYNLDDLITYFPYRYNLYKPVSLEENVNEETIVVNGYIEEPIRLYYIKKNLNKLSFRLLVQNKLINVVIFNRGFLKNNLKLKKYITVIGKYNGLNNTFTASDIRLNPILKIEIEPVYHLNVNIKKANFLKIITSLLKENYEIKNYVPDYLMRKYGFMDKLSAIRIMHNPTSLDELKKAKVFLIYEELFVFMLKISYMKTYRNKSDVNNIKNCDWKKVENFINNLPFKLTVDQVNAIEKINEDFNTNKRMNRLLLGDVGSGKTIVSFVALYINYLAGYQGVLMAPTEILAEQHYNNMINLFKNVNINIGLITGSFGKSIRSKIIQKLKNNEIDVLIGTHSVLNDELIFNNLGLVITDEQHRFGVNQRKNLARKGNVADVLYMSATPIPRTIALTLYGDMDISQIKTKPSNRKEIKTLVYSSKDIKEALFLMLEEIKKGHQIYVVAPIIDDNNNNMESVNNLYNKLNVAFNSKVPIEILHGKLKSNEKNRIMENFKNNITKILISTTVIEVGIDVKNATTMVVFNAERFGLATLHQLRGRIGRNELDATCILISDYDSPRLKILEESNDGFYISEKDFELRGSGDLFGVKQSGDMSFKIANIKTDFKILMKCKEDSEEFLKKYFINSNKYLIQKELINSIYFNN